MNVLTVFYKHKRGGFNKRFYRLMLAIAENGDSVHYVAVESYPLDHPNIIGHVLPAPFKRSENSGFWLFFLFAVPLYIFWIACRYRADMVITFSGFYAFLCTPLRIISKLSVLTFLRADILRESSIEKKSTLRIHILLLMERIGLHFSDHIVPNSRTLGTAILRRYGRKPSWVLPNHIEKDVRLNGRKRSRIRSIYGLGQDDFIIVTASPINRVKNIGFLIRAFSALLIDSAHLLIIGEDINCTGEKIRLQRICTKYKSAERITFSGWVDSPFDLIAASDLFVFTSLQEGSPNALLEGLSCNIPCLGSKIPEIREILKYDELLFSLSSPSELSQKISRAIIDPVYYERILDLSRHRKEKYVFDWDNCALEIVHNARQG